MSGTNESLVFFDIDTQVDFMCPTGRLYVPGAEQIVPNLERLMRWARQNDVPVISSADAHSPDDPEFKIWPPHCVVDTPGQRRISETLFPDPVIVPNRAGAFRPWASWVGQLIVEKNTYSVADNPNFELIVQGLGSRRVVLFGVATEYCVLSTVLELRHRGFQVDIVLDAIRAITDAGGDSALHKMSAAGAGMGTTAQVCDAAAFRTSPST